MTLDRRHLIALTAAAAAAGTSALAQAAARGAVPPSASAPLPFSALGLDAAHFGSRAGAPDDQSAALQRAIAEAAARRVPLALAPGVYRASRLTLPSGAQLVGIAGATRFVLTQGPALFSSYAADDVSLTALVLDGGGKPLSERGGLVHLLGGRNVRLSACEIVDAGQHGIVFEEIAGEISGCTVSGAVGAAIVSHDARGLAIRGNTILRAGNNGILVWRARPGEDGTRVIDNRIAQIGARDGGSGQNGNAINVFRAGNVIVRGNHISEAAFSAVRGNAASGLQVLGNSCSGIGEVALYVEFAFEGAVIANNTVDGAALGVSVTNFNAGGRLAVVQGNLIRNLTPQRPPGTDPNDVAGIGIGVEADTAVSGNVIENAPTAGIWLGWGQYLRDVAVTGNIVRNAGIGIAVSVVPGAGSAVIADNLIAGVRDGGIVGMEWKKAVTGDLATEGARRAPQLSISGNRVR